MDINQNKGGCNPQTQYFFNLQNFNYQQLNSMKAREVIPQPHEKDVQFADFSSKIKTMFEMIDSNFIDEESLYFCYQIYENVRDKGGVVEVTSINQFHKIAFNCAQKWPDIKISSAQIDNLRKILFSYQFTKSNPDCQLKIYDLGMVNFIDKDELKKNQFDIKLGYKYFVHDTTLFQQGADALKIDKFIFNLDYMSSHYKDQIIDIRIQNPLDYGFKPSKLKNKAYKMKLSDYRFYQENYQDPYSMQDFKHLQMLNKGQIFFGVNFQPADQMLQEKIKKHVSDTFLDFHNKFDLLSYLDTDVPGCSTPQMYFKVPGCWTGGHQQNINMSALNINHGPDQSEWFTLQLKYVENLRAELNEKFGTDLYLSEGLWYEKLDWFIKRGYPVKRFLQRRDDIVVTGPGTLHWVRSFGSALQTSWNIMFKTSKQLEASFFRHKCNKQVNSPHSAVIPLKSILVKFLNHERQEMDKQTRLLCTNKLKEWLQQEQQILANYKGIIYQRDQFYLKDLESFCTLCNQQILLYYLPAPKQKQKGICCLECHLRYQEKDSAIQILYCKLSPFFMWKLIQLCSSDAKNQQFKNQIEQLCRGEHVGELGVSCKIKQKKENQQIFMSFKDQREINKMQRQILYGNNFLFELYGIIDKVKNLDKMLPDRSISNQPTQNMTTDRQEKRNEIKPEKVTVSVECQTDNVLIVEEDEYKRIQKRSTSRDKKHNKKKKHHDRSYDYDKNDGCQEFGERKSRSKSRSRSNEKSHHQSHSFRSQEERKIQRRDQKFGKEFPQARKKYKKQYRDYNNHRRQDNYHDRDRHGDRDRDRYRGRDKYDDRERNKNSNEHSKGRDNHKYDSNDRHRNKRDYQNHHNKNHNNIQDNYPQQNESKENSNEFKPKKSQQRQQRDTKAAKVYQYQPDEY